jgi:CBS domain-containing protein
MLIRDVIAAKGSGVITVWPAKTLEHILNLFEDRNIASAVVVEPNGRPIGLVNDRRVMRILARDGRRAFDRTAEQIMISPPPTCTLATTVSEAQRHMTEQRFRHLVVMDGARLAGLVSIGDLVKARMSDAELEGKVLRDIAMAKLTNAA